MAASCISPSRQSQARHTVRWQLYLNDDLWHGNQPLLQRLQQPLLATILSRMDLNFIITIGPAAKHFLVLIADSEAAYLKAREYSSQKLGRGELNMPIP